MGKAKKLSNKISSRPIKKKMNPFEVHVNRKKHNVLGQRSKTEKGLPGIARSRAIKKRKATLLQEYNLKSKNNLFVDRRIGEKDSSMTNDDKIIARYTTERMRFHSKKSLYNLDDNEVLTHRGESLADIEKFEDPKSDDEDDDDGRNPSGKLDKDFVSEAHFGGGMLRRVDGDNRSRKDLIDDMIAESKMKKAEQQKLRAETLDLTEKLDTDWKDLLPLVHSTKSRDDDAADIPLKSESKFASYDKLSKELKFEARGKATDKLKSELTIAEENMKKLNELEQLRKARMLGEANDGKRPKHRSADDLDEEGFDYYDEGRKNSINEDVSEDEVVIADEEDMSEKDQSDEEESTEERESDSAESEDESDDDLSDLVGSDKSDDGEKSEVTKGNCVAKPDRDESAQLEKDLKNLAFTLSVPDSYDEFASLVFGRPAEYQAVVLERMVKCNHPSLPGGSRQKLINLYKYCLQHLQDTAQDSKTMTSTFLVLDKMLPWLYDLAHFATATTSSILCDVVKEKYADFLRKPHCFPSLDTLVFFKLVGVLYPTSDYRHRIVTPTLLFMQHILASCRIQNSSDIAVGLFITTLLHEFTVTSKRLVPEVVTFLRGVLRCGLPSESKLPFPPPFKPSSAVHLRVPSTTRIQLEQLTPLTATDLATNSDSDLFKLRALKLALRLLEENFRNFQSAEERIIVQSFSPLLILENFPCCLNKCIQPVIDIICRLNERKLYKLVAIKNRPKPLRLYEPKIEEVYTFRKKKAMSKEKEERERLVHKYKKEVKGALREIRRDNAFLSKLKLNETLASDLERKRKVKEIFGDAAQQAGELRKLKRAK